MSLDWQSLHDLLGLPLGENRDVVLTGVNSLRDAGPGEVSFLGNSRYEAHLADTEAAVVLVPRGNFSAPPSCALIEVPDPSVAFSKVVDFFQFFEDQFRPGISSGAHVDPGVILNEERVAVGPGAVIEDGAEVGEGTTIGAGCLIGRKVKIGRDCFLHPGVIIRERCLIGDRVILQPGCVIGSDGYGFDLVNGKFEKVPQLGIVEVGDDVEIGANTCIDRARFGKTVIGEGTKIDNLVQIAHNVVIGKHCLVVAQSGIAGSTSLGNYVTIAAQAGVAGHLELADQVVLAGQSGLLKSVKAAGVYLGNPARPIAQEQKRAASTARLPLLKKEVQELKKKLEELSRK